MFHRWQLTALAPLKILIRYRVKATFNTVLPTVKVVTSTSPESVAVPPT